MSEPLAYRLRRLWLDVHLWLGVGLLVVLAPLSLAGSVLVWHDPLDRALHPERYAIGAGPAAPMAQIASSAEAAFAGRAQPLQLRLPQAVGDPAVAVGRLPGAGGGRPRSLNAWIDPASGRVLGLAEVAQGFSMTLHRFHGTLLVPGAGRKLVGWLGWALFVSCATGLWLWWPKFGALRAALGWRRGASQLFNLHHALGFWICLPLAALAFTGVFVAFPQSADRALGQTPPAPRAAPAAPLEAPRLKAAEAIQLVESARPGVRITALEWPVVGLRPAWRLSTVGGAVEVDDASGGVRDARRRPAPGRGGVAAWMRGVHDGSRLGPLWQWIITLAGVAPTVLGFTGLVMWLRRPRAA